jgi:hypothetical protein
MRSINQLSRAPVAYSFTPTSHHTYKIIYETPTKMPRSFEARFEGKIQRVNQQVRFPRAKPKIKIKTDTQRGKRDTQRDR